MSEEKMLVALENAPVGDSHSNLYIWGNGSREVTAIASVQVLVIADDFSSHCLYNIISSNKNRDSISNERNLTN